MRSLVGFILRQHKTRAPFGSSGILSMMLGLFFASALYAQSPPDAPSGLSATTVSNSQIDLAWTDNSNDEDGFIIQRATPPGGPFTNIDTVNAEVESFSNTGLSGNTAYNYRVVAYSTNGNSDPSNEDEATTNFDVPAAPSNLAATAASNSQIDLTWHDNSGGNDQEDQFVIERKTGSGGTYAEIGDTGASDDTTFSDTGLTENVTYYYRVLAQNTTGNSGYSNEVSVLMPLGTPTDLAATTVSNTQINLAWSDNSSVEDSFKIELKIGAGGTYAQIATTAANATSYNSMGLVPNTMYYFRVRAYKASNHSAFSNEDSTATHPDPPAAPSSLGATAVSNTQINLAWTDNSSNESGFKIERKLTGDPTFTPIDTTGAGATSYASTGLGASTSYTYRVRAFNDGGNSAYSNQASATTLINPPAAPTGLSATTVSNSQIDLSWTDNATTESGFKIERKAAGDTGFVQIATTAANASNYSSTGLAGSTQYFYRVRAFNAGGNSAYSDEDDATTLQNPPAAPSGLNATTVSNEQIDLAWTDNSGNEDGFKIEIKVGTGGTYTLLATTSSTNYSSMGLEAGTEYFYRVYAYNGTGNSGFSNEDSATTLPEPPAAPDSLSATTASQTQINLNWKDHSSNEAGFLIERKLASALNFTEIDTVGANVTSYPSTGLTANTEYTHRVRAYNAADNSAYSNEANATTLPNPPSAPSALDVTAVSNTQIDLTWTDNSNNESGFRIERKTAGQAAFTEITTVGAGETSYANTGLSGGTKYFYQVRAFNTGGNSAYSNVDSATTLPNPPLAPSALAAMTISNTQINLSWTDNANNEDGFSIERKTGSGGVYCAIDSVNANVTSYANTGLTASTEYFYRVRAYNVSGNSNYSNEASATTLPNPPAAPSGLMATVASNTQINLKWLDQSNNETGFIIERKTGAGGTYTVIDSVNANDSTYASMGLAGSTEYFYRVHAYNAGGNSSYSNVASATTQADPLAAPSGLTANTVSSSQIDLSWTDNSNNETGFKIERRIPPAAIFSQIAIVGANATNYSNTSLTGNTIYVYRVRAYNAFVHSGYSNTARDTTLSVAPAAPSALLATTVSNTQINLTWTDNAVNEDGFKIERKRETDSSYTEIASIAANSTNYASTGLNGHVVYYYRLRAFNNGGHSGYSNSDSALTLLKAPSNLVATAINGSQIDLTWTDGIANETGFAIERKTGMAGTYTPITTVPGNTISYSNTGLAASTQYFYRVRAVNAINISAYSNEDDATTLNLPGAPDSLTATAVSNTQINLMWLDKSSNEDSFKIERKTGAAGTFAQIAVVGANVTSYANNTGLNANINYVYRVRARNAGGHSSYSNEAGAKTLIKGPANLTATTVSGSQIDLTWTDHTANELGFKIERKQGAAGTYAEIAIAPANATSYPNTGLAASTQYFYRVRAFHATNVSAYSNEDEATTLGVPAAPDSLIVTAVSNTQINLVWQDKSADEQGFIIERKTGAAGTFAQIATVSPNVTNYANTTGLNANVYYAYRVRSYNTGGNSSYSNEAGAKTLIKGPANLTAAAISSSQIDLAWIDQTTSETGFKVERKTGAGGTFTEIATLAANATSYQNTGLPSNTQYFYRVRAFNATNVSAYSNEDDATTLGPAKARNPDSSHAMIPEGIVLAPNYPNPFNPSTTIAYSLSEGMHVKLTVLNVNGQVVAVLANGYHAAGQYQRVFKGRDLPSGVYYAVLKAGAITRTQRMLLTK